MPVLRVFSQNSSAVIRGAKQAGLYGITAALAVSPLIGKTVFFQHEETRVAGLVQGVAAGKATVRLAVPNADGILLVSDATSEVDVADLVTFEGITENRRMCAFSARLEVEPEKTFTKKYATIQDAEEKGLIEDYLNVSFAGYASTFQETTAADRDNDYVLPGAFSETLAEFSKNPVMLIDHRNSVANMAGSYSKIATDRKGLMVQGNVSNAPGLCDVRFLIVEGHLKSLSIGGFFYYAVDGHGIEKVQLFEISLTPVPANQDALFTTRSITLPETVKAYKALAAHKGLNFKKK